MAEAPQAACPIASLFSLQLNPVPARSPRASPRGEPSRPSVVPWADSSYLDQQHSRSCLEASARQLACASNEQRAAALPSV